MRVIRTYRANALYSTAGPFSSHVVGLALHSLTGLPWVVELRDGWQEWNRSIFSDYPLWRGALERRLEASVVRRARRVILVTEPMAAAFRNQYSELPAEHFCVVSNGFDPAQLSTRRYQHDSNLFEIVHAGSLYRGRSIAAFIAASRSLARRNAGFARAYRLSLLGSMDQLAQAEIQTADGVTDKFLNVHFEGYLDHRATLDRLARAASLLLISNTTEGAEATVPGKLFEYLAARRPVLAVVPSGSASGAIVEAAQAGWVAPAGDEAAIVARLEDCYEAWAANRLFCPSEDEIHRYDRSILTAQLAAILDRASGPGRE